MNRRLKKLIALALTVAMVFSLSMTSVFAYSSDIYSSNAPKETVEVDETELSGATAAANTTAMSILGINVTSTDVPGAIGNADDPLNLLVFGSDLNENPDPYLWNFYYNFNANEETYPNRKTTTPGEENDGDENNDDDDDDELTDLERLNKELLEMEDIYNMEAYTNWEGAYTLLNYAKAGPTGAANNEGTIPIQVNSTKVTQCNPLFYFEPNILMGGTEGTYTTGLNYYKYESGINPNYTPLEIYGWSTSGGQYAINTGTFESTVAMANGVYTMAKDIDAYAAANNLTGRYGNVLQCGIDYSNFMLGIYYFVQNRLEPIRSVITQIPKSTYCTGISVSDSGEITVTNSSESTMKSNQYKRYLQYLDGIADYVEADPETVYGSYGDLKKDVDLIIMDTSLLTHRQIWYINRVNIKLVDINSVMPNTVYGTTMQSTDNALGVPYFVGLLYEGRLSSYSYGLSEYDYIAYYVKNIYHVKDEDVETVVAEMLREGGGDVYDTFEEVGLTPNYEYYINEMIEIGAWYYAETELGSGNWKAIDDQYLDDGDGNLGD